MNRLGIIAGMAVLGIFVMLGGEVRADHDHELRNERQYRFGAFSHVDDLAVKVMRRANSVCWEMYRHYRYEPGYRQTYRGAYEMLKTAEYIHELVHHGGRRSRVSNEIEELDKLYHEIKRDVKHWQRHGQADYHDVYYARGGLNEKMRLLETDLHHLMDDAGYKPKKTRAPRPEAEPAGRPAPRQGAGYRDNSRDNSFPQDNDRKFKNYVQRQPAPQGDESGENLPQNVNNRSNDNIPQELNEAPENSR